MKLQKRIKDFILKYEAMELRVNALEASLKKVQQMNVLLSQENSIQSRLLGQVSSLLQPRNAVKFCDHFHPNCSISRP